MTSVCYDMAGFCRSGGIEHLPTIQTKLSPRSISSYLCHCLCHFFFEQNCDSRFGQEQKMLGLSTIISSSFYSTFSRLLHYFILRRIFYYCTFLLVANIINKKITLQVSLLGISPRYTKWQNML